MIQELKKIYQALDSLHKDCEEEGFALFDEIARTNAKQILEFVYSEFPDKEYYVYPTEDREVAISCNPQKGRGVLILCESGGSIICFSTFNGKNRRFRHNRIEKSFYTNLHGAFKELNSRV